jgi:hypothetical protein
MAPNSIVRKLIPILSERMDSECKVVYVLAQTRKLLDARSHTPHPFALRMHCNWALHVGLNQPKTALPFLHRVETYVESVLARTSNFTEENRMMRDFVFLDTFKDQFKQFLDQQGLPTAICDENERWRDFVTHYAGVIEDGSISCTAPGLETVKKVVFTKGRSIPGVDGQLPFRLMWTIHLRDERTLSVEAAASSLDSISSVITLQNPK